MKNPIYNLSILLCTTTLLFSVTALQAQEDKTKKEGLNREMTLEREFAPTVNDVDKVNSLPAVQAPVPKKMSIDYSNYTLTAEPQKLYTRLTSGDFSTDVYHNKKHGYLNLGAGSYTNINGDFGYHILNTATDRLNVFFSHSSSNGNVNYLEPAYNIDKAKMKLNDNSGGIDFSHDFSKFTLNMGAKYGYSHFNYYGQTFRPKTIGFTDLGLLFLSTTYDKRLDSLQTKNQTFQTFQLNAGITSHNNDKFGYDFNILFNNFDQKHGIASFNDNNTTERTFTVDFDFFSPFRENQKIGIEGNVNFLSYSGELKDTNYGSTTFETGYPIPAENHIEATLSPYYKLAGDNWHFRLGANAMFITGNNDKVFASPNIAGDITIADKTLLYASASGRLQTNSLYNISLMNRYVNSGSSTLASRNWLDAKIGLNCGAAPGFWFGIFGGYRATDNDIFFTLTTFSNHYRAILFDSKQFYAGANLKYSYQDFLDFTLKGVYNHWSIDKKEGYINCEAFGRPQMEVTTGITVRPIKKLSATIDYHLATSRYAYLDSDVKMKDLSELNLRCSYSFNETFGFYASLNNILNRKQEIFYNYPIQGINVMAGVNINF